LTHTNYQVIVDLPRLEEFVRWLPETGEGETFYVALLARNKYAKGTGIGSFNSDRYQCKRFLSTADRLIDKIRQLECPLGAYRLKDIVIPQASLALYITVNPRDLFRATRASLVKFAELIAEGSKAHNPHAEVLSQVHKSPGHKHFVDVDFDGVRPEDMLPGIAAALNLDAVEILRTRGGFHALVRLARIDETHVKTWYRKMMALPGVDIRGDNMIPVPGCVQGDFVPVLQKAAGWAA
jgi:hypothetical protein